MTSTAHVTVTIEYHDGTVKYKDWVGTGTITRLKASARAHYQQDPTVKRVSCGSGFYRNHYGAH
jgi:nitroimidazol reductase NimA-like FMN-containing flavoprotein (pyridoxamine 5'-phosphate oxidase superfamily)